MNFSYMPPLSSEPAATRASATKEERGEARGLVTLLVGGTRRTRKALRAALSASGSEVLVRRNAKEARSVVRERRPNLVILGHVDAEMLAFSRDLRAEHGEAVSVLAVLGEEAEGYLEELLRAGIDDSVHPEHHLDVRLAFWAQKTRLREERARIRRQLEKERNRLRQYLDIAGVVFVVLDREGRVTRINRKGCDLIGLPEGEIVGKLWFDHFIPERLRKDVWKVYRALMSGEGGASEHYENPILTASGEERLIAWSNAVIRNEAGEITATLSSGADITERKRMEDALRQSEERFRTLYNQTPAMLHSIDREGRLVSVSDYWLERMGYARDEVIGRPLTAFMTEDSRRRAETEHFTAFFETGSCRDLEYQFVRKDGAVLDVLLSATAECDAAGRVVRSLAVVEDVTERKRTEDALRESEARGRAILETTVDGIVTVDEGGIIRSFNQAAERIFGYAADEVLGKPLSLLMPSPYREEHDGYIRSYLETGHRKIIGIGREVYGLRKDGSTFPMELAVSEVRLRDGVIFTGIVRDITDRRRLEQEILRISDQERRRIGQDLHDGLGQMLTGIGLISQNLARVMSAGGDERAGEVEEITELIKEADQYARSLARGLVPVDLDEQGLATALSRLAKNAERLFGITCTFEEVGSSPIYDENVAIHLYRIAQEAVSNAVKHGRASTVRVMLAAGEDQVRLRIQDDGVGFPDKLDDDHGMGVRIMQYRARMISGVLDIRRGLKGGSVVTCTLTRVSTERPDLRGLSL